MAPLMGISTIADTPRGEAAQRDQAQQKRKKKKKKRKERKRRVRRYTTGVVISETTPSNKQRKPIRNNNEITKAPWVTSSVSRRNLTPLEVVRAGPPAFWTQHSVHQPETKNEEGRVSTPTLAPKHSNARQLQQWWWQWVLTI